MGIWKNTGFLFQLEGCISSLHFFSYLYHLGPE